MATSKAIEAARAFIKIYADDNPLKQGLSRVVGSLKSTAAMAGKILSGALSTAGGLLLADSLTGAIKSMDDFARAADKVHKASKRTGASAEAISQLQFAAERSGTSIEAVEKGMSMLGRVTTEAANGSKTAAAALAQVGLAAEDIQSLTPDDRLLAVAEAISRLENPADRTAAAMKLMGEQGVQLLPMMEEGAAGVQAMMQQADVLGLTMTDLQAATGAQFADALDSAKAAAGQLAKAIGSAVLPAVTAALNWILAMTPAIIDLAKAAGSMLVEGFQFAANAVDGFLSKLTPAWQEAKDSLSGFAAALAAGDIPAAASVLWATLKLRWAQGTKAISDEWAIWSKGFLDTFANAMTAIQQLWQQTSNWLAKGIVELMGLVDSSINVEAVQAELEIINQQEQSRITREAEQAQAARDNRFEQRITAATADLEAAKKAWAEALAKANTAGERAANEPTAAAIAENKFSQLIRDLKAGDVAARIDQAVGGQGPQDIRSIGGVGQITRFLGGAGELNKMQIQILREVRDVQRSILTATKADRVGYVV